MIDATAHTFPANLTLRDALARFETLPLPFAVVVEADGTYLGTVREAALLDVARRFAERPFAMAELADASYPTVTHDTTRRARIELLSATRLEFLPVLDDAGLLLGIETLGRLLERPRLDTTVVVMAGGRGTRLHSVTHDRIPKPMVPLGARPLLEVTIERLAAQGFHRLVLCVHHHARVMMEHFGDGERFGVEIEYVVEDRPLGTAGGLARIPRLHGPFLVLNGDILTEFEYENLLRAHDVSRAVATIGVRPHVHQVPFGVIRTFADGRIMSISEKPVEEVMVNAGIYVLSPDVVRRIVPDKPRDMVCLLQEMVAAEERVMAFPIKDYWLDVGTPRAYVEAVDVVTRGGA